jgi:hypothetical protein
MEYHKYIDELNAITSILSQTPSKIGFHHKFYVPGWTGFIQSCIVEHQMNKAAKRPIYQNLGYFECGDKIDDLVAKACQARVESSTNDEKDNNNPENLAILEAATNAINSWRNIYPEIADLMTLQADNKHMASPFGVHYTNITKSLSLIVNLPKESQHRKKEKTSFLKSIWNGLVDAFGAPLEYIVTLICNLLLAGVVIALISGIIDLFKFLF